MRAARTTFEESGIRTPARLAAVLLLAFVALPAPAESQRATPPAVDAVVPDTILTPPGQPRIVVLRSPGSPTVTLRASVPLREEQGESGAGRLLAAMAEERARAVSGPVSARIEGRRTPTGVAYSVSGARQDLDYLAYLLRVALSEPRPGRVEFQRARNELLEEVHRTRETPSRRMARALRIRAFPSETPVDGTLESLEGMTPTTLRNLWRRSHGTRTITVLVVGDVPRELLLASLQGMGRAAAGEAEATGTALPPDPGGETEVLRRWYGEARVLPDATDPRGTVAALLVAGHMRRVTASFEAHVELWQVGRRQALAVIGASYRASAGTMRSAVRDALTATADGLSPSDVEAAAARVRREALFDARSPWGRAALVSLRMEVAGGDSGAVRAWLDALDAVTAESMRAYLTELAAATPVRTEVTP